MTCTVDKNVRNIVISNVLPNQQKLLVKNMKNYKIFYLGQEKNYFVSGHEKQISTNL